MKPETVTLYEYNVSVDAEKYYATVYKYKMRFTGKNYISEPLGTDEIIGNKFNTPPLHRIGTEELMQIRQLRKSSNSTYVNRRIYFLKEDFERAKLLVNTAVAGAVDEKVKETALMHKHWREATAPKNPLDKFTFCDEKNP
jgi:hypothetical protein